MIRGEKRRIRERVNERKQKKRKERKERKERKKRENDRTREK
jgi:hypothetical protein